MNQMINNFKKSPSILIGAVVLLICVGFVFFRANQLTKLSAREADLIMKLDTISRNVKNSQNIELNIQELEDLVDTINERLFIAEERSTNIDLFYSFEERLDIKISEVKQQDNLNSRFTEKGPDELKLYSVIDYSITVSGTFKEIVRFLYEIYQIEAIARVTEFQVEAGDMEDSGNLSAKINVAVLAQK